MAVHAVVHLKAEFDVLCSMGMQSSEDPALCKTILGQMIEMQDKILTEMADAPKNSSSAVFGAPLLQGAVQTLANSVTQFFHAMGFPAAPTEEELKQDMQTKIQILTNLSSPRVVDAEPSNPFSVGFRNLSANCWANALLQLMLTSPSLQDAYKTVAMKFIQDEVEKNQRHGQNLLQALIAYHVAFAENRPVNQMVSQDVRLAFHHFFGHNGVFSESPDDHEDAWEALQMLMGKYEIILKEIGQFPPAELYRSIETKRHYRPVGDPREPDAAKLQKDDYSKLGENLTSSQTSFDYQIYLDLQNKGHLTFPALLLEYFRNTCPQGHDRSVYLRSDGKIQDFELIGETRQFTQTPDEFLLTIKRFGMSKDGVGYKVLSQLAIERTLVLPAMATAAGIPFAYALDGFIVHGGGYGVGHYVAYKKIDGRWVECNDHRVRFVSDEEIDRILHGLHANGPKYTSYIHHYSRIDGPVQAPAVDVPNKEQCERVIAHIERGSSLEDLETLRRIVWIDGGAVTYPNFGEIVLKSHPQIVKEITLPYLIGGGLNLIDQLLAVEKRKLAILSADPNQAEKLQYAYERDQLQAFHDLLIIPELKNIQLFEAFKRLDVRDDLKEKLYWLIWIDHGMKEIANYGSKKFQENPRCLLEIHKNMLTEPPICRPNADILEQLIALLYRQSC